jgi:phospholipase/carboxylesterase
MNCVVSARLVIVVVGAVACSPGYGERTPAPTDTGAGEAPPPAAGSAADGAGATGAPAPPRIEHESAGGVEVTEIYTRGADNGAPLVVVLHGQNGSPDDLVPVYASFPAKARIILPRAAIVGVGGYGFSWFTYVEGMTEADFAAIVAAAAQRLAGALDELVPGRRMLLGGYSQGGFVTYALAVGQVERAAYAFPVATTAAWLLLPERGVPAAPILAFHGVADAVIPIDEARGTVGVFQLAGDRAELREYPGVGHAPSEQMQQDIVAAMVERLVP